MLPSRIVSKKDIVIAYAKINWFPYGLSWVKFWRDFNGRR
jgi:hypothetical protein